MSDPQAVYAQAISAFNQQQWRAVLELASPLLQQAPGHPGVHYIAGVAALELGRIADALAWLRRAATLDPLRADYAAHLARALSFANQPRAALQAAESAMAIAPDDAALLDMLGNVFVACLEHAHAIDAFNRAVTLMPAHVPFRYNLATAFVGIGDADAAREQIQGCLEQDQTFWRAHLTLAHLDQQSPQSNHVETLQRLLDEPVHDANATTCLNMALAKEYEDLASYDKAFTHLVQGKRSSGLSRHYSSAHDARIFAALQRAIPDAQSDFHQGHQSSEPIFIFGMPRSGTTLVERIVSSHPNVQSAGELQTFGLTLRNAWNSRVPLWDDPSIAQRTREIDWERVGEAYLTASRPEMKGASHFIDKLPHNFLYAGFIALAFPNAKLICVRRNAMDTCLGNFRQLFAEKLPYYDCSHDLLDTGRYYIQFDHLMRHWQNVLPGRIAQVGYESMIEAPEPIARRLLEHLGLPWDDRCLDFAHQPGAVLTASALQVRKPIHQSAVDRWRHYEPWLGELAALLTESGVDPAAHPGNCGI